MASLSQSGDPPISQIPMGEWPLVLGAAAKEVFFMMVGAEVTVMGSQKLSPGKQVAGVIGIGGAFTAVLTLRCSMVSAGRIAAQMLGVPAEDAAAQCSDAIAEICNIIAGHFKAKIGHEATCMLSLPSVITGTNYSVHSAHNSAIDLSLLYADEPILILMDIRK